MYFKRCKAYFIIKLFVKIKYVNILNIIAKSEIIPELLQSNCNEDKIYEIFNSFMLNPELGKNQLLKSNKILDDMKINSSSSSMVANILKDALSNTNSRKII